jgi:hypothetical protein
MHTYSVFEHPTLAKQAVRQGFAYEVMISEAYLGLSKQKWRLFTYFVCFGLTFEIFAFFALDYYASKLGGSWGLFAFETLSCVLGACIFLYAGSHMAQWSEEYLVEQGYSKTKSVQADGAAHAIAKS